MVPDIAQAAFAPDDAEGGELRRVHGQDEHRVRAGRRTEDRLHETAERDQGRQSSPAEQEGQGEEHDERPTKAALRGCPLGRHHAIIDLPATRVDPDLPGAAP
jgi:hypothetical protein